MTSHSVTPCHPTAADRPDVETLLSGLPESARVAWAAEIAVAEQGMHGPALSAAEVDTACRDYVGNGNLTPDKTPNLKHFRGYLRNHASPARQLTNGADFVSELQQWAAETDAKEKANA